jgi:dienelactone hydrolase
VVGLGVVLIGSLIGAAVAVLAPGGWRTMNRLRRSIAVGGLVLAVAGLLAGGAWLLDAGSPPDLPPNAFESAEVDVEPLDLPDPSQPGPYTVARLTYGSGEDRHRPEYGAGVDLITPSVDGSALVEGWSALRTAYWGHGPDNLPLNARVWYPEGEGPFPLVLVVHGQHPMEDYSDPGYAYLGELLASRGFIVASVDQNYLNLSPLADLIVISSLQEVEDLRGWLLLEHLRLWRDWRDDPGSPFYNKVDMERIALIGHSRGGEAVAVAAAFNELPYYPDDAALRFDYGYGIRSVVAYAPVDGNYQPAGRDVVMEDVNYLVLHGAHDMDVFTFQGDRHYSRVRLGEGQFKAAIYIYGANHGQFNTRWGRKDLFEPVMRLFNLEQLMPAAAQRQVAEVTVSAFLEATLYDRPGYRVLFGDLRRGAMWLPDTIFLHQYQDADTRMIATYEEDLDLTTTTLPGGALSAESLTIWREQPAEAKRGDMGDQTVYLGWATPQAEDTPRYSVLFPRQRLTPTEDSVLVFAMADADEDATPAIEGDNDAEGAGELIDLTVEVVDDAGQVARLPLSHYAFLQPQLHGRLGKAGFMAPLPTSEVVLQHFEFPLTDFLAANPALDPAALAQVRFVFDRTEQGVVVLDNVGLRDGGQAPVAER